MTTDLEIQPDLSENEEQEQKLFNHADNLSDLSLSSTPELRQQQQQEEEEDEEDQEEKNDDLPPELYDQIDEVLNVDEDDLTKFITKARQQGFNCLDLSKKNIIDFPPTLLEFPSLQVNSY